VRCLDEGLSYANLYAAQLVRQGSVSRVRGHHLHADEDVRILDSAGTKPVLLLRNHGPTTIGHTLPRASASARNAINVDA
jgi:hypothetical protein